MAVIKHGHSIGGKLTKEYRIFVGMHARCRNPRVRAWKNYGGRGITVCPEWKEFLRFYQDMGKCPEGMSLNRIDNDLGYSKENCEWTTAKKQCLNMRKNVWVMFRGKRCLVALLAEQFGINPHVVRGRLRIGWDIEKALSTPVEQLNSRKTHCKWGHPLEWWNLRNMKNGERRCKICTNAANKRYKQKSGS